MDNLATHPKTPIKRGVTMKDRQRIFNQCIISEATLEKEQIEGFSDPQIHLQETVVIE